MDDELSDLLSSTLRPLTGSCHFEILNATPSGWQVVIIEVGVKFFYRDGTDDIAGPRRVNLQSGQRASFFSGRSDKCVYQVFAAIKARAQGEPNDQTFTFRDDAGDGYCFLHVPIQLGEKKKTSEGDIKSASWGGAFEITRTL